MGYGQIDPGRWYLTGEANLLISPDPNGPADSASSDVETLSSALRERVYVTLSGLSAVLILLGQAESFTAVSAAVSIGVTMGGLWAASLVAELVAYSAFHTAAPRGKRLKRILFVAGQALETALGPVIAVSLSATGLWTLRTGLIVAAGLLVVTQILVAVFAVTRSPMSGGRRILIVAVETLLCAFVIAIKLLAH